MIGLGLQAVTPAGGAAAGAAGGAYACWNSTAGTASALLAAGKCALLGAAGGALASTFGIPIGTALGFVLEMVVSLTIGSALILLLLFNGMYYSNRTTIGILVELMPGLDIIPGWTFMTIMCVIKKRKDEGMLKISASNAMVKMLLPGTALGTAVKGISFVKQQQANRRIANGLDTEENFKKANETKKQHINTQLKSIDGIKPAAINVPRNNQPYEPKTV